MAERQPTPAEEYQAVLRKHADVVVHGDAAARAASSADVGKAATEAYIKLAAEESRILRGE